MLWGQRDVDMCMHFCTFVNPHYRASISAESQNMRKKLKNLRSCLAGRTFSGQLSIILPATIGILLPYIERVVVSIIKLFGH